jgi:hypothetical protein
MNRRGKPLISHQAIVQLIGSTATDIGLEVCCAVHGNHLYSAVVRHSCPKSWS